MFVAPQWNLMVEMTNSKAFPIFLVSTAMLTTRFMCFQTIPPRVFHSVLTMAYLW